MKEYRFKINGKDYHVSVNGIEGKLADVSVNGVNYQVEWEDAVRNAPPVEAAVPARPEAQTPSPAPAPVTEAAPSGGGKTVTTPLPGVIISVNVRIGQAVKRGDRLAVLEAMKMENDILASCDGTVTAIHVHTGDTLLEGADVATIG